MQHGLLVGLVIVTLVLIGMVIFIIASLPAPPYIPSNLGCTCLADPPYWGGCSDPNCVRKNGE